MGRICGKLLQLVLSSYQIKLIFAIVVVEKATSATWYSFHLTIDSRQQHSQAMLMSYKGFTVLATHTNVLWIWKQDYQQAKICSIISIMPHFVFLASH